MKVERFESSLHPRIWSFNRHAGSFGRHLALITDGAGEAETDGERFSFTSPAMLWLGGMKPGRLRVEAGATGCRAWATDAMLLAALGDQPDAIGLRQLVDRSFALSLAGQEEHARTIDRCMAAALAELRQPMEGSALLLSALLRIMLVSMARVAGGEAVAVTGFGEKSSLLQRFRRLVEMNFRSHWTVARYADALGISTDRLHAICTTGIGKSPKALLSERLAHEAALRLERSPLTIQQIGHALGFNDPAHFSNFFRRMTGTTPARYRKAAAGPRPEGTGAQTPSFADWP